MGKIYYEEKDENGQLMSVYEPGMKRWSDFDYPLKAEITAFEECQDKNATIYINHNNALNAIKRTTLMWGTLAGFIVTGIFWLLTPHMIGGFISFLVVGYMIGLIIRATVSPVLIGKNANIQASQRELEASNMELEGKRTQLLAQLPVYQAPVIESVERFTTFMVEALGSESYSFVQDSEEVKEFKENLVTAYQEEDYDTVLDSLVDYMILAIDLEDEWEENEDTDGMLETYLSEDKEVLIDNANQEMNATTESMSPIGINTPVKNNDPFHVKEDIFKIK